MKKLPQFSLIGEPLDLVTNRQLEWLIRRSPTGSFASGDFSAATDNVKIELTRLFFELFLNRLAILKTVSAHHMRILRAVLYEHEIEYPKSSGLDNVVQANGQLMGSVLSFPVLCAINLCTYWHAVQPHCTDVDELNVLINGDDILFRTNRTFYQRWLDSLPLAGFVPSPGKNFFHPRYCTVNTQLFNVTRNVVTPIPFFNAGMLLGQSKVSGAGNSKPVWTLYNNVIAGASDPTQAHYGFLHYNHAAMTLASKSNDGYQMNYFLPTRLGGLGLKNPNLTYLTTSYAKKLTRQELAERSPYVLVNKVQHKIATHLHKLWTTPYTTPPCKPIGERIDLDRSDRQGFPDIKMPDKRICVQGMTCPQPPFCEEIEQTELHEPNWRPVPYSLQELELLGYRPTGVKLYSSVKKLTPINQLIDDFREYKFVGA